MRRREKKIRVLLVDDHPMVREGIRASLSAQPHIRIVGEAANGLEAVQKAKKYTPDIIVMDINLPIMSGLEATRRIRTVAPRSKVLALTMHDSKEYVMEIARIGGRGYVMKDAPPSELLRAIEAIHAGEAFFSPRASRHILKAYVGAESGATSTLLPKLTSREKQVLQYIADGLTTREIAEKLGISVRTAGTHRDHIMKKFDVHTAAALTKCAIAAGLVKAE